MEKGCSSPYMHVTRAPSFDAIHEGDYTTKSLKANLEAIRATLNTIGTNLNAIQNTLTRQYDERISNVYGAVLNDINDVRKECNTIGDNFARDRKFKTWAPLAPFRKEVRPIDVVIRRPHKLKLKSSKSLDFVDTIDTSHDNLSMKTPDSSTYALLNSRSNSIDWNTGHKSLWTGYGCCISSDRKASRYRSYLPSVYRDARHSWGPSRSGSRSTLDDNDHETGQCYGIPDNLQITVIPHQMDDVFTPGFDISGAEKLQSHVLRLEEIRYDIVVAHNDYRRKHGCPDLVVNLELTREAQIWAETLAFKEYAQYSDTQSRGENIMFIDLDDDLTGREVVDMWYQECRNFNYKHPRWQRGTANFTQMIWKSSTDIGVGISKLHETYIIVVQYKPPGNINTICQYRKNVPLPSFDADDKESIVSMEDTVDEKTDTLLINHM